MSEGVRYRLPALAVLPLAAAGVCAALGALSFYNATRALNATYADPFRVQSTERALAPVRVQVPLRAVVGYISDVSVATDRGRTAFFATQYALAPRLLVEVEKLPSFEYVIGNWDKPAGRGPLETAQQLTVVQDFGNGVVLYRKGAR
jgi:hypothetical protein